MLGLLGFLLGILFTFLHEKRFASNFKVVLGHPAYNESVLIGSSVIKEALNYSELNPKVMPNLSFKKKLEIFEVMTENENISEIINSLFERALQQEINTIKANAQVYAGYDDHQIIFNNNDNDKIIFWANKDIAQIDTDEVMESLSITYGVTETIYPDPILHGVIGLFAGLVLALGWMMLAIVRSALLKKSTKKHI